MCIRDRVNSDLPFGSYYVKELSTNSAYVLNEQKSKFIGNISAQIEPSLNTIDEATKETDNFGLCLCLFCALRTNGNGLFIVGGQGYIILFQWLFPHFQH